MPDDAALRLYRALVRHDPAAAISVIEKARAAGTTQSSLFDTVYAPALAILGGSWADGSINEYVFTQAAVVADQILSFVAPPVAARDTGIGVIVGSMHGDTHDVGKNIMASALRDAGHRVVDLGVDVRPARFLERVEDTASRIVIVCAQMVSTARAVRRVREMFLSAECTDVALLVSGSPFVADPRLVSAVGADGVVRGAEDALHLVAQTARTQHGRAGI